MAAFFISNFSKYSAGDASYWSQGKEELLVHFVGLRESLCCGPSLGFFCCCCCCSASSIVCCVCLCVFVYVCLCVYS